MRMLAAVMVLALGSTSAHANDKVLDQKRTVETEERSPAWFGAFVVSSVLVVGSVSIGAYGRYRVDEEAAQVRFSAPFQDSITEQDCDQQYLRDDDSHFDAACRWSRRTNYATLTTLVAVPIAIFTGYLAFRALPKKEKRSIALIPTVTTQSAGALLDVSW